MSSAITNAGEALIALHQNRETGLVIDKFILANIPGVDPAAAVDRAEGKPAAENIVYEYAIPEEGKGYINPNQVVYSMLLGSDIGDFEFNWLGLYSSADDTVVAITYCPTLSKWKTAHPTMGNALTRNFMLEYSGLQATTQITVEASTWQIDFTTRQKGIDERERLSNRDIYGGACFFGDGYLIINEEGTFTLQPGTGYVEGIRIDQVAEQILAPVLPAEAFLDVALQPQGSDRLAIAQIVYADPGDYTDGTNDTHYGQKIAEIDAGGVVTDCRPKTLGGELGGVVAAKDHSHRQAFLSRQKLLFTDTILVQDNALLVVLNLQAPGGGGVRDGITAPTHSGAGGGGGGYGEWFLNVTPGEILTITIGAAGVAGNRASAGDGDDVKVESNTRGLLAHVYGGHGAKIVDNLALRGLGGTVEDLEGLVTARPGGPGATRLTGMQGEDDFILFQGGDSFFGSPLRHPGGPGTGGRGVKSDSQLAYDGGAGQCEVIFFGGENA